MSMLVRKGTVVVTKSRGSFRKQPVRRTRSAGSAPASRQGPLDPTAFRSVPASPVTKVFSDGPRFSPARSTGSSTILSYESERQLVKTSLDRGRTMDSIGSNKVEHETAGQQLSEASKEEHSFCCFYITAADILCRSSPAMVCYTISIVLPICMITLGVKYLTECPIQPRIPVYQLVAGCFWLLKIVMVLWKNAQNQSEDSDLPFDPSDPSALTSGTYKVMDAMLATFLLAWHALGTYWCMSIYVPAFRPSMHSPNDWCDHTLYVFTVCQNLGGYVLLVLVLLSLCCVTALYRTKLLGGSSDVHHV